MTQIPHLTLPLEPLMVQLKSLMTTIDKEFL